MLVCKLDISQAFDTLSHQALWRFLKETPASPESWALWRMNRNASVLLQLGSESWAQPLSRGLLQGTSFSADVFSRVLDLFLKGLLQEWRRGEHFAFRQFRLPHALLFADDILLFATSTREMQTKLRALQSTLEAIGLRLNFAKCSILNGEDGSTPVWGAISGTR